MHRHLAHVFRADETKYPIVDLSGEKKWGFSFQTTLRRAKVNKGKFLKGHSFYCTPNLPLDHALLKTIIHAHGGVVCDFTLPFAFWLNRSRNIVQ
jgi:hypothetical protein